MHCPDPAAPWGSPRPTGPDGSHCSCCWQKLPEELPPPKLESELDEEDDELELHDDELDEDDNRAVVRVLLVTNALAMPAATRPPDALSATAFCRVLLAARTMVAPAIDRIAPAEPFDAGLRSAAGGACDAAPFRSPIADFYLTNPIARASAVMAECSALRLDLARQAAE